ncbi:MAG: RHS repeat protein, partial [Caldisericia bacterium]|nr:RHS repeat protein [Caldisericia bacterium]
QTNGAEELKRSFVYNASGWVTSIKDSYNNEMTYSYDDVGHITVQTYPPPEEDGTSYLKEWTYSPEDDIEGLLTQYREKVTSVLWNTISYSYTDQDSPSLPSSITNSLNQTTAINYNSLGQATSITKDTLAGTKSRSYTYNPITGILTKSSDYDGNETTYTYSNNGQQSVVTQYEGNTTTGTPVHSYSTTYNSASQVTAVSDSITSQSSSNTIASNGEFTSSTSMTSCQTSSAFEQEISSVDYKMPKKDIKISPIDSSPFPGSITYNPITNLTLNYLHSYNPTPYTNTNSMSQTITYSYNDDGTKNTITNHLGEVGTYAYDTPGRISTYTNQAGMTQTLAYNRNSLKEALTVEDNGTTSYTYDDRSQLTSITYPIKGTISITHNVRGDQLTDEKGTYTYDLLGRKTNLSYTGGGSNSWSYTPDGMYATKDGDSLTYDDQGNTSTWTDGTDSASFSYSTGYTNMGLPNSLTGTAGVNSSYAYTYGSKHWLNTINNTSKQTQGSFTYSWSTSKELTNIANPNSTQLVQTYTNKQLDWVRVQDSQAQNTYLSSNASFNGNDQMTGYSYSVSATPSNLSETYSMAYHTTGSSKGKLNTLTDSNNKVTTYGYNASNGMISSVQFSNVGTYTIARNANGTTNTITYPNQQGTANFTYNGGQGKLSQISMPGSQSISLNWNGKNQISSASGNNSGSIISYSLTYNNKGQTTRLTKSSGGIEMHHWIFNYGPYGLEKGRKYSSIDALLLTQDYTTDTQGRVLSMTYTDPSPAGSSNNGEYYFHYDNFGNMCLLTDSNGSPVLSYEYALHNGKIINTWNPNNIENILMQKGQTGVPALTLGTNTTIGDDFIVPVPRPIIGIDPIDYIVLPRDPGFDLRAPIYIDQLESDRIMSKFRKKNCRGLYRCVDPRAVSINGTNVIRYKIHYFFGDCPQKAPMDGLMMIFEGYTYKKHMNGSGSDPTIIEQPPINYPKGTVLCTLVSCECENDLIIINP